MTPEFAYLAAAALGACVAYVAFPGKDRWIICLVSAIVGAVFAGAMDMEQRGSDAYLAKILDPLADSLAALVGADGVNAYAASANPCPAEDHPGQYGNLARYDGTIMISGSPEFVSRTVTALNRLYDTPSYRFAKALKRIEERQLSGRVLAQVSHGYAEVAPKTARMSCTIYAGIIVHEGAHVIYGSGHGPVYAAQARALEEMGETKAAGATLRLARNY